MAIQRGYTCTILQAIDHFQATFKGAIEHSVLTWTVEECRAAASGDHTYAGVDVLYALRRIRTGPFSSTGVGTF